MSEITDTLIHRLKIMQGDDVQIRHVKTDDLGEHWVMMIEPEDEAAIWFYVDEINRKIVVEHIGARS